MGNVRFLLCLLVLSCRPIGTALGDDWSSAGSALLEVLDPPPVGAGCLPLTDERPNVKLRVNDSAFAQHLSLEVRLDANLVYQYRGAPVESGGVGREPTTVSSTAEGTTIALPLTLDHKQGEHTLEMRLLGGATDLATVHRYCVDTSPPTLSVARVASGLVIMVEDDRPLAGEVLTLSRITAMPLQQQPVRLGAAEAIGASQRRYTVRLPESGVSYALIASDAAGNHVEQFYPTAPNPEVLEEIFAREYTSSSTGTVFGPSSAGAFVPLTFVYPVDYRRVDPDTAERRLQSGMRGLRQSYDVLERALQGAYFVGLTGFAEQSRYHLTSQVLSLTSTDHPFTFSGDRVLFEDTPQNVLRLFAWIDQQRLRDPRRLLLVGIDEIRSATGTGGVSYVGQGLAIVHAIEERHFGQMAIHEIGHLLQLGHHKPSLPGASRSIMYPTINPYSVPSWGDQLSAAQAGRLLASLDGRPGERLQMVPLGVNPFARSEEYGCGNGKTGATEEKLCEVQFAAAACAHFAPSFVSWPNAQNAVCQAVRGRVSDESACFCKLPVADSGAPNPAPILPPPPGGGSGTSSPTPPATPDGPTTPGCGDGRIDRGEQCDDGNRLNNDGCDQICRMEMCGNGAVQRHLGEECEKDRDCGATLPYCVRCRCQANPCGDSKIQDPEECDPPGHVELCYQGRPGCYPPYFTYCSKDCRRNCPKPPACPVE